MPDYESIVILTGAGISAESGVPTFRDKTGVFSVEAVFLNYANGVVAMERVDGKGEIRIPFSKLSAEDVAWLKDRMKK